MNKKMIGIGVCGVLVAGLLFGGDSSTDEYYTENGNVYKKPVEDNVTKQEQSSEEEQPSEEEQEIINNLKNNPRTVCMAIYNGNEMFTNRIHFDQNCSILKRHLKNDGVYYYSCLLSDDFIKNASFCPLCSPSALTVDRVGEIFE